MKLRNLALVASAALYVAAPPFAVAQTTGAGNKQQTEKTGGGNKTDSGMEKGGSSSGGTQNSNEGSTLAGKKKGQN